MAFYFLTFSEFSSRGVFCSVYFVFRFLGPSWGCFFAYFVLPTSPLSVGAGLGNRAPIICGTGHASGVVGSVEVVFGVFRVIFLLALPTPLHALEQGVIWIKLATPTGERGLLVFLCSLFAFP